MAAKLMPVLLVADRTAILRYAEITGDFNPIHVDPDFAARTPMGGPIAHGTLSLNLLWQSIAATFGSAALQGASLDIRFSRPVREGDHVQAGGSAKTGTPGTFDVWVRNSKGENVIEGSVTLKVGT